MAVYQDRVPQAIALAIYALLIVGTIDNLIKMLILHGQRQLHPLLALLSVLGGIQALGPIGILIGPLAVTLLQTTLSIFRREVIELNNGPVEPIAESSTNTTAPPSPNPPTSPTSPNAAPEANTISTPQ
jgi:predicted PurR-regulated permease PerM